MEGVIGGAIWCVYARGFACFFWISFFSLFYVCSLFLAKKNIFMEGDLCCESGWNKLQKSAGTFQGYLGSMPVIFFSLCRIYILLCVCPMVSAIKFHFVRPSCIKKDVVRKNLQKNRIILHQLHIWQHLSTHVFAYVKRRRILQERHVWSDVRLIFRTCWTCGVRW